MSAMAKNLSNQIISNKRNITSRMYKSKVSPTRRLQNILKPILAHVFKLKRREQKRSSYIASEEKEAEFEWLQNDMDNLANEQLENQLIDEIQQCVEGDAIIMYGDNGTAQLKTMDREQYHVPVHFARTNEGTFFWTSVQRQVIQPYDIEWNFLDRWAQA